MPSTEWVPQVRIISPSQPNTVIVAPPYPQQQVTHARARTARKGKVDPESLMPFLVLATIVGEVSSGQHEMQEWEFGIIRDDPHFEGHRDYIIEKLSDLQGVSGEARDTAIDSLLHNIAGWAAGSLNSSGHS